MDSYFIRFRAGGDQMWTWRKIDKSDDFGTLKRKVFQSNEEEFGGFGTESDAGFVNNGLCCIRIHYLSVLRASRFCYEPNDRDNVLATLEREEGHWPGVIEVSLADRRIEYSYYIQQIAISKYDNAPQPFIERHIQCTEWIPQYMHQWLSYTQSDSYQLSVWEAIFNELCEIAVLFGTIQRKVSIDGKSDVWRDELVIIHQDRIWLANMKNWDSEKQFYSIELTSTAKAVVIGSGNSSIFSISCQHYEELTIQFKCKSQEVALSWIYAFNNRYNNSTGTSVLIQQIERSICDSELDFSMSILPKSMPTTMSNAVKNHSKGSSEDDNSSDTEKDSSLLTSIPLSELLYDRIVTADAFVGLTNQITLTCAAKVAPCSISLSHLKLSGSQFKILRYGLLRTCCRIKSVANRSIFFASPTKAAAAAAAAAESNNVTYEDISTNIIGLGLASTSSASSSMVSSSSSIDLKSMQNSLSREESSNPLSTELTSAAASSSTTTTLAASSGTGITNTATNPPLATSKSVMDEFIKTQQNESANDGLLQFGVVIDVYGVGLLLLYDPVNSFFPNVSIQLNCVKQMRLSKTILNCIELVEESNCVWSLIPLAVDEADELHICDDWLNAMFPCLAPRTQLRSVRIVYSGFVFKRGAVNKSFKRRWMILSSDGKLRYYKDFTSKVFKGLIALQSVESVSMSSVEVRSTWRNFFGATDSSSSNSGAGRMEFTLHTSNRAWIFQCESAAKCNIWCDLIRQFVGRNTNQYLSSQPQQQQQSQQPANQHSELQQQQLSSSKIDEDDDFDSYGQDQGVQADDSDGDE